MKQTEYLGAVEECGGSIQSDIRACTAYVIRWSVEDKPNFQEIPFHHEATAHEQTINLSAALYLEQQVTSKQSINQQFSIWSS